MNDQGKPKPPDELVLELLQRWEDLQKQGKPVAPEELCRECPELLDELKRRLKDLQAFGAFVGTAQQQVAEGPPRAGEETRKVPSDPPILEGPGSRIGPYKLLQKIGEGAFGIVYMAEQEQAVRRRVALKIIKPGMDTRQVIARFEAERQALAMMDHANIARVLDAGATETGRPFFVMDLVKGVPFTQYCDDNKLTPVERLELFIPVCQAIQHAHQKGIIHRDIKPSNVLVTLYDGKPVPKVIDFGLAKAMEQRLTERTMFTEFGRAVGTLGYMSPEQAGLSALDIDTRSDIYSLGVMLYELLTGGLPFERKRLRQAAYDEMLRIIREEEPPKPSARLSTTEEIASVAAQRKTEPKRLTKLVRGELDWIVMKCLEKDRTRRYETANGLGRDIQRYLADEPVEAGPPSATYRFKKFARKYKKAFATAAAFAFLLLVGIVIITWQWWRANYERDRATKNFRLARRAVDDYSIKVSESEELKRLGLEQLRKSLLQTVVPFYEELRQQQGDEPDQALDSGLAGAYRLLAEITEDTGSKLEAIALYEKAVAVYESLSRDFPHQPLHQVRRANTLDSLGGLYFKVGKSDQAEATFRKAMDIREELVRTSPGTAVYQFYLADSCHNLGIVCEKTGRGEEAERLFRREVDIGEELVRTSPADVGYQRNLANALNSLGGLYSHTRRTGPALIAYRRALELREKLVREHPADPEYQHDLTMAHFNLGVFYLEQDQLNEAMDSTRKALEIDERLARAHPTVTNYQRNVAETYDRMAGLHQDMKQYQQAEAAQKKSIEMREKLARERPEDTDYQCELAAGYNNLAGLYDSLGRLNEGADVYRKALDIYERLARAQPTITKFQASVGRTYNNLATLYRNGGKGEQAEEPNRKAIEILDKLYRAEPSVKEFAKLLQHAHRGRAQYLTKFLGRHEEAIKHFQIALELDDGKERDNLRLGKACALARHGDHRGAKVEAIVALKAESPSDYTFRIAAHAYSLASTAARKDMSLSAPDRDKVAEQYATQAMQLLAKARAAGHFKRPLNLETLKNDPDLAPLRSRDDFKKLLGELEKKVKKQPTAAP